MPNLKILLAKLIGKGWQYKERRLQPKVGKRPKIGGYIAHQKTMMRVTAELTGELWDFFSSHGWVEVFPKTDRRRYRLLPDSSFDLLQKIDSLDREELLKKLLRTHP